MSYNAFRGQTAPPAHHRRGVEGTQRGIRVASSQGVRVRTMCGSRTGGWLLPGVMSD
jgi:hypothetical protein